MILHILLIYSSTLQLPKNLELNSQKNAGIIKLVRKKSISKPIQPINPNSCTPNQSNISSKNNSVIKKIIRPVIAKKEICVDDTSCTPQQNKVVYKKPPGPNVIYKTVTQPPTIVTATQIQTPETLTITKTIQPPVETNTVQPNTSIPPVPPPQAYPYYPIPMYSYPQPQPVLPPQPVVQPEKIIKVIKKPKKTVKVKRRVTIRRKKCDDTNIPCEPNNKEENKNEKCEENCEEKGDKEKEDKEECEEKEDKEECGEKSDKEKCKENCEENKESKSSSEESKNHSSSSTEEEDCLTECIEKCYDKCESNSNQEESSSSEEKENCIPENSKCVIDFKKKKCSKNCDKKCKKSCKDDPTKKTEDCFETTFKKNKNLHKARNSVNFCKAISMKKVLKQIDKSFIDTKNEVRIICDANKYKKKALKIFKRCLKYKIKKQKEDEFKESTEKNLLEKISKLFLFLNGVKEPKFKKEKIGKSFSLNKKQNDSDDNLNIEEAEDTYKFHPKDNTFDSDMVINFKKSLFNDIFSASRKVLENNPNFKQQKNFKILNKEMKKAIKEQIEKYKEGKKIDKPLLDEIGEEILEVSKKIKNKKAEIGDAITKTLTKNEDVKEEKESQQIPKKEEPKQQTKNDEEKVQPPPITEKTKEPIEEKFPQSNISNDEQPINNQQIPYSFYPHRDTAFHTFLKNRNPGFDLINSEIYNQYPLPNYNYSPINFNENSLRNKTTNINDDLGKFGYRPVLSSLNSSNSRLPEESLINNLNPRLPQNILEKFGYKPTIDFNNHIGLDTEYYSPKNEPEYFKESPIEFISFVETNHNYNNPPFKENNLSDCHQNNSQMVNLEDKEKERNMKDAINKGSYVIKDRRNEGVIILDKKSLDKINQSNSYTNSPNFKRKEKKVVYLSDIFHIN